MARKRKRQKAPSALASRSAPAASSKSAPTEPTSPPADSTTSPLQNVSPATWIVLAAIVLGLMARGLSLSYAPSASYKPDHTDFLAWAAEAYEKGPTRIYERLNTNQNPWLINYRFYLRRKLDSPTRIPHACNYLPLSTYVFWFQGWMWSVLDDDVRTLRSPREAQAVRLTAVRPNTEHTGRVANTLTARFVGAFPSIVLDFLLAWGVALLVRALRGENRSATLEAAAFAITLLAPPIFLNSAFWNQVDAWIATPLVWSLYFLIRRRFVAAGVIYGLALVTKPQAIFLGPVLLFIFVALRLMPGGSWRRASGVLVTGGVALLVALLVALPHSLAGAKISADRLASPVEAQWYYHNFLWFKRGFVDTVAGDLYPRVSYNAFNIWWFDFLSAKGNRDAMSSTGTIGGLGITKDLLGKLLLGAGIVLAWVLCARKWGWRPESWLACAFLVTFAAFLLPTRAHERYIYTCIPFLIALAAHRKAWFAPLALLLIVGTFEMTAFSWGHLPKHANQSGLLAVLSILAMLISYGLLIPRERLDAAHGGGRSSA